MVRTCHGRAPTTVQFIGMGHMVEEMAWQAKLDKPELSPGATTRCMACEWSRFQAAIHMCSPLWPTFLSHVTSRTSATAPIDWPEGRSRTEEGVTSAHVLRWLVASAMVIKESRSSLTGVPVGNPPPFAGALSEAAPTATAALGNRRRPAGLFWLMEFMRVNMVARFCRHRHSAVVQGQA